MTRSSTAWLDRGDRSKGQRERGWCEWRWFLSRKLRYRIPVTWSSQYFQHDFAIIKYCDSWSWHTVAGCEPLQLLFRSWLAIIHGDLVMHWDEARCFIRYTWVAELSRDAQPWAPTFLGFVCVLITSRLRDFQTNLAAPVMMFDNRERLWGTCSCTETAYIYMGHVIEKSLLYYETRRYHHSAAQYTRQRRLSWLRCILYP